MIERPGGGTEGKGLADFEVEDALLDFSVFGGIAEVAERGRREVRLLAQRFQGWKGVQEESARRR